MSTPSLHPSRPAARDCDAHGADSAGAATVAGIPAARGWRLAALAIAGIAIGGTLGGCDKADPSGQVVARVNGQEITTRDIRAELASAQLPPGTDIGKLTPLVLSKVIDRKLVAAEGKRLEIDKSPDYLSARERADEVLLGDQTLRRWNDGAAAPSTAAIQRYIAANPAMFADRQLISLVQLRTAPTTIGMASLAPMKTIAQVRALFDSRNVKYQAGQTVVDTAQLPPEAVRQLRAAAGGEPLVEQQGGTLLVSAVAGIRPAPMPAADREKVAAAQLTRQEMQRRIDALRTSAKIEYQKGYGPPAAPAPAGTPTPAAR